MQSQQFLVSSLYQIGAIQFGEYKLKSGEMTPIYINLRRIISYPAILKGVAAAMWDAVKECKFELICGVPYTALPIATCLSLSHDIPMIMRRRERKDYGTKQLIEGDFIAGQRCLIIEDVITSGASIIETAADLQDAGLKTLDCVVLIDREQGGRKNLETKNFGVHTILTLPEILNYLLASNFVSTEERFIIEQFLLARSA